MEIRLETAADHASIRQVQRLAFGRDAEARLVDRLRIEAEGCLSLLAVVDREVVAHVLFSEARLVLERDGRELTIGALGPVAVLPERQRQGLGSALIRAGLARGFQRGWLAAIVLGNPKYYTRFGFERADRSGIRCALDVPAEAFLIAWAERPLEGPAVAHYHVAFADV